MIFFDKDTFKRSVEDNVKLFFRKKIGNASKQELFQAVAYAVKDQIIDEWIATHKAYEQQDAKILYYMSMEFLMGRALGNMLINMSQYDGVREVLQELGLDLNELEDQEPDPALGNGGIVLPDGQDDAVRVDGDVHAVLAGPGVLARFRVYDGEAGPALDVKAVQRQFQRLAQILPGSRGGRRERKEGKGQHEDEKRGGDAVSAALHTQVPFLSMM